MRRSVEFETGWRGVRQSMPAGFTLIELIIAIAVSTIVAAAIYILFVGQQGHYRAQSQVTQMQQNLRAAVSMMKNDLRMVGYDPKGAGSSTFGLKDISLRNLTYTLAANGNSTIQFTYDKNGDGKLDSDETITYSLADYPDDDPAAQDGISDLTRCENTTVYDSSSNKRDLVAENIEAMGIAYAFDVDGDGKLDTSGGNIIWAIDTDGDNQLDNGLDTNGDGKINAADTAGGAALAIGTKPGLSQIRAVRIWLLARAEYPDPNFTNTSTYVIAGRHITENGDHYRRRLLDFTVYLRNTGL